MRASSQFRLSLKAIQDQKVGINYDLDGSFFVGMHNELISDCNIAVSIFMHRQADMIIMDCSHQGVIHTACDRCLEQIEVPVRGERRVVLKMTHEEKEEEDNVIFVHWEDDFFDVSQMINEMITFSLPMVRVYDCESDPERPCNEEILKYLQNGGDERPSVLWEQLKDLKLDD